jgi:hypothetical protein
MQSILKSFVVLVCAVVMSLSISRLASAQSIGTADMTGRVLDQQGAVLPGVTLILRATDSGLYRQGVSGPNGVYQFTGMLPGMYQIEVELSGFRKYERSNLKLEVGKTLGLDVTMELGAMSEGVTVTAENPIVDLTSKTVGGFVETRELVDLPTANRSFTSYLSVLPGVVGGNIGGQGGTLYSFDGGNLNDATRGGDQVRIPIEAIQEFQLIVSQPDAQFGANGGVINAVSKTGTNEIHGTALSLIRDSALQERSYFEKLRGSPKPDAVRNQFAFSLGGPIVLNKMHYFGTYEHHVTRQARTPNIIGRPDINVTKIFPSTTYNVFARVDHQASANHTWSARVLSEYLPSLNTADVIAAARTAEDHDQQWGATLNSVFGSRVNSLRFAATREDYLDSSVAFKEAGYRQERLLPTLAYNNFTDQQNAKGDAVGEHTYLINDTLTWSVPNFKGSHQIQAGFEFAWTRVYNHVQDNLNGTFRFSHNLKFDAADPRTWPDQFAIRVPIESKYTDVQDYYSAFIQDKWNVGDRLTMTLGVRYEIENMPIKNNDNPKFPDPNNYPIDKNNVAPRTGFAYALNDRTVVRGGWGMFFQRTTFSTVSPFALSGVYASSFTFTSPANNRDGGPSAGRFPTDPFLATFPVVNRALLEQRFPEGSVQKNTGTIRWDDPSRRSPFTHQYSIGAERQLRSTMSVSADYSRKALRDLLMQVDLNPQLRRDTTRNGTVDRPLMPEFVSGVVTSLNLGWQDIDQLGVSFNKRYTDGYSFRAAYTWSDGWGNISNNNQSSTFQLLEDLNLEMNEQVPSTVNREHNIVLSGTVEVPKTKGMKLSSIARYTSGQTLTITDSSSDPDRNGVLTDPLPAGTYSGVAGGEHVITVKNKGGLGGARAPGEFNIDARFGWKFNVGRGRNLELYGDVLNLLNTTSFSGYSGDRRTADFLVATGVSNTVRTLQLGARIAF